MTVLSVTTLTAKPDRYADYLAVARTSKTLLEKHGAKNVRLLAGLVGGEATGTLVFTSEADDFASSGAITDKLLADPEGVALLTSSMNSGAGPIATIQTSQWVEIPL